MKISIAGKNAQKFPQKSLKKTLFGVGKVGAYDISTSPLDNVWKTLHVATAASGRASIKWCKASIAPFNNRVSLFNKKQYWPVLTCNAWLFALPNPRLSLLLMRRTWGYLRIIRSTLLSAEPLSTTITSIGIRPAFSYMEFRHWSIWSQVFQLTMQIETAGKARRHGEAGLGNQAIFQTLWKIR